MGKAGSSKGTDKPPPAKKIKVDDEATESSSSNSFTAAIASKRKELAGSVADFKFNKKRCRLLSKNMELAGDRGGGVLYWMSRDQRVQGELNFC